MSYSILSRQRRRVENLTEIPDKNMKERLQLGFLFCILKYKFIKLKL